MKDIKSLLPHREPFLFVDRLVSRDDTSVVGEYKPITAGSFCTGSIIIDRTPPIERVFYKVSQWLRSR